jgi:MFS family permease
MVDLSLFKRPAFVGAQTTAFAISASTFSMFLYLTLYLQDILGLSPLATGLRFLPLSVVSFFAAPIAGRLSAVAPVRLLLGVGLALNALALWLMSGITVSSGWTTLLPGFIVAGVGVGLVNAPLASTAVSTVRQERAGMASGINNTFRQIGIATGIAALGAIFQSRVSSEVTSSLHGVRNAKQIAQSIANGGAQSALRSVPHAQRAHVAEVAKASFISGLNDILITAAIVALVGAVLATFLVRRQDFVASGGEQQAAAGAA